MDRFLYLEINEAWSNALVSSTRVLSEKDLNEVITLFSLFT